jgi:hypothetical protein
LLPGDSFDLGDMLNEQLCYLVTAHVSRSECEHPLPGGEQLLPLSPRAADVLVLGDARKWKAAFTLR